MLPGFVLEIIEKLKGEGFEAVAVGGCVRDTLLGRTPADWDIATAAEPGEVARIFEKTAPTGLKYGTVTVFIGEEKAEVTTFRADGEYLDKRRPETVTFSKDLISDLGRRDFTVNAVAVDEKGNITDPFGGAEDIKRKIIRCVGDPDRRFNEDALRMLRALRFSVKLNFEIAPDTMRAIEKNAPLAAALSAERVREELGRILLTPRPEMSALAVSSGLLDAYLDKRIAPEKTALARVKKLPDDENTRLFAWAFLMRAAGAVQSAAALLKKLRLDGKTVTAAEKCPGPFPGKSGDIKLLLHRAGREAARLSAWASCALGDVDAPGRLRKVLNSGECWELRSLAVKGKDLLPLGLKGEEVGRALESLLFHVINTPEDNDREKLLSYFLSGKAQVVESLDDGGLVAGGGDGLVGKRDGELDAQSV